MARSPDSSDHSSLFSGFLMTFPAGHSASAEMVYDCLLLVLGRCLAVRFKYLRVCVSWLLCEST